MRKSAFYNEETGGKADTKEGYTIEDNQGLDPGYMPLPVGPGGGSTAALVNKKGKRSSKTQQMRKNMNIKKVAMFKGFAEESKKLAIFNAASYSGMAGMGGGGGMGGGRMGYKKGGVVTSKSKRGLGPKIQVVSSKIKRKYGEGGVAY